MLEFEAAMSDGLDAYAPGTLVIDFGRWPSLCSRGAFYVPVYMVERVGTKFYTLRTGGTTSRLGVANLNKRSLPLPGNMPWRFPREFSALAIVARIVRHPVLLCVDELGKPFPRGTQTYTDEFTGRVYEFPKEYALRRRGYVLRELSKSCPTQWFWAESTVELLKTVRERLISAEATEPDRGPDRPALVETSFSGPPKGSVSLAPFPATVLDTKPRIEQMTFFAEVNLWVLSSTRLDLSLPKGGDERWMQDLPNAMSGLVFGATFCAGLSLYFSNDGRRWWRDLSGAIGCEIERLQRLSSAVSLSSQ